MKLVELNGTIVKRVLSKYILTMMGVLAKTGLLYKWNRYAVILNTERFKCKDRIVDGKGKATCTTIIIDMMILLFIVIPIE